MEHIYIKNFGPIREAEIMDIRRVTVLIGASGSGKSTIMKIISLFRWIYKMMNIRSFLKYSGIRKSPFRFQFINLLKNNGLYDYLQDDTVLIYEKGSLKLVWDSDTKKLHGTSSYVQKEELSLEKISFISDKRGLLPDILDHNVVIKHNMYYLSETYSDFEIAAQEVKELNILDLGVKFVSKKTSQGKRYSIEPTSDSDKYSIKLNEASSGTQNLVPISVIAEYYARHYDLVSSINKAIFTYVSRTDKLSDFKAVKDIGEFKNKNVHLLVEEPELSLFPSSQTHLVDYLVSIVNRNNQRDYDLSLMFATHSPYIVNHLNVLIRRYNMKVSNKAQIAIDDLGVYYINEGNLINMVGEDPCTGERFVDTYILSEEMENIYNEYTRLKNSNSY